MWFALTASFVAGLGGLSGKFTAGVTGAIALVPGAIALIATTLKFEAKSDWHYKKLYSLSALRERLKFEMPLKTTLEHVSAISRERRELLVELNQEWSKTLTLDFSRSEVENDHKPERLSSVLT